MNEKGEVILSHEVPYTSPDNKLDVILRLNVYVYVNSFGDKQFYDADSQLISGSDYSTILGVSQINPGIRRQLIIVIRQDTGSRVIIGTNGDVFATAPVNLGEFGD